jgi:hypothetical protein
MNEWKETIKLATDVRSRAISQALEDLPVEDDPTIWVEIKGERTRAHILSRTTIHVLTSERPDASNTGQPDAGEDFESEATYRAEYVTSDWEIEGEIHLVTRPNAVPLVKRTWTFTGLTEDLWISVDEDQPDAAQRLEFARALARVVDEVKAVARAQH